MNQFILDMQKQQFEIPVIKYGRVNGNLRNYNN